MMPRIVFFSASMLVFLNAYRNNSQAHGTTIVALHPELFTGNESILLASSSKDNTRIELVRVEMDFYGFRVKG